MASFFDDKTHPDTVRDYGPGTTSTNMLDKYDAQTCVCMWGETKITNFDELTDKWYTNIDAFMKRRKDGGEWNEEADGEVPFCVQFCSPYWLPKIDLDKIQALRDYFCEINWEHIDSDETPGGTLKCTRP